MLMPSLAAAASQDRGRIIDRDRIDRPPTRRHARRPPKQPRRAKVDIAPPSAAVPITGIRFIGAEAPAPVATRRAPVPGQADQQGKPAGARRRSVRGLREIDVALYTVAIPDQDFAGGLVAVSLTEGRIATRRSRAPGAIGSCARGWRRCSTRAR